MACSALDLFLQCNGSEGLDHFSACAPSFRSSDGSYQNCEGELVRTTNEGVRERGGVKKGAGIVANGAEGSLAAAPEQESRGGPS